MSLFFTDFKKELEQIISKIGSKDFQIPDNWTWWSKKEEALLEIEKEDIEIIKEIEKLYKRGHISRKLTSEILRLAIELRDQIEIIRKKPGFSSPDEQAKHINSLITELDAFLNEELAMETLGIEIGNLILYHGSATPNLKSFNIAEEATVGSGIYLTDEKSARGYAIHRANFRKGIPVIYKFRLNDLWLADLSSDYKVRACFTKYVNRLKEIIQRPGITWHYYGSLSKSIQEINSGKLNSGNLKFAVFSNTTEFSRFLIEHGYDGLITWEGGEGDIGRHISYVIFDPSKIELLEEILVGTK